MSCHVTVWVPSWTGWHILPRSHAFNCSRLRTGIYFVTLVHRWNIILGDSIRGNQSGRESFHRAFSTDPTDCPCRGWATPSTQLIFGGEKRRPEIRLSSQSSESGLKLVSPGLSVFPGKSDSQSLIIISLITSNGWHYICPRSVCCRSIVVLVIV